MIPREALKEIHYGWIRQWAASELKARAETRLDEAAKIIVERIVNGS